MEDRGEDYNPWSAQTSTLIRLTRKCDIGPLYVASPSENGNGNEMRGEVGVASDEGSEKQRKVMRSNGGEGRS